MKKNKIKIKNLLTKVKKILKFKNKFVPLHEPTIEKKDIYSVINCLQSTFISSAGKKVHEFEDQLKTGEIKLHEKFLEILKKIHVYLYN